MPNPKEDGSTRSPIRIEASSEIANQGSTDEFKVTFVNSPDTPLNMEIYERVGEPSFWVLHWPTPLSKKEVEKIIREFGNTQKGVEYICLDRKIKKDSVSYCGTLSEAEQIALDEHFGSSPNLDRVFTEDFTFLRASGDTFSLAWDERNGIWTQRDTFSVIARLDLPLAGNYVRSLVERSSSDDVKPTIRVVLEAFEQNMTNYLATSDYSNSPKPKV